MKIIETAGVPINAWVDGVEFEDEAREQLERLASLPIIFDHVAVMPDVHAGIGATVGSVIATKGAIIPSAVGVDIGCGMVAVRTSLRASDLPDDLASIRSALERVIPVGFAAHQRVPASIETAWKALEAGHRWIVEKYPKIDNGKAVTQLGTLGGGNHYVELVIDEEQFVWLMLHSGSRGIGNKIGTYFIGSARDALAKRGYGLPDQDLAWLEAGTEAFDDYVRALRWAQDYARANRAAMVDRALDALRRREDLPAFKLLGEAVNCHHNYASVEEHFGERVIVTRKGAVSARAGEFGLIPGSMGARSYVVRGKGNVDSFHSCSHGAGRRMGRTEAKRRYTAADLEAQTAGIECRKDAGVVDEIPSAYKSIEAVIAAQRDLIDVVHELRQVLCIKG
jgi:tRNA-splicing ligase RtcB